ncbi:MAG: hypothetical protein J0I16_18795 [Rhizobiales bacterium]|nr:hypothetical protein [Hyphomicrobiales bacterium]
MDEMDQHKVKTKLNPGRQGQQLGGSATTSAFSPFSMLLAIDARRR